MTANEWVFGKVLDKNVPSADGQLLNFCSIAQFLLDCLIVLGLPKLLPKESRIAQLLPSASTLLNTFVICCFVHSFCPISKLCIVERISFEAYATHIHNIINLSCRGAFFQFITFIYLSMSKTDGSRYKSDTSRF